MSKSNGKKKQNIKNSFDDLIDDNIKNEIDNLYKKISLNDEFEVMFFNYRTGMNRMGFDHFLKILEFMTYRNRTFKLKLENYTSLDIIYNDKNISDCYRISINGIENINKYMEMLHLRKNHVIFSVLIGINDKDENITIIKKTRNTGNVIDIDDFNIRFRLSKEEELNTDELDKLKNIDETKRQYITFRYKQRASLYLQDNEDALIKIDLTNVKMSNNINQLDFASPIYELEIDVMTLKKKIANNYLDIILKEITTLLKIIQQSNYLVTKTEEEEIIDNFSDLLGMNKDKLTSLELRKAQSLEIQHVVDKLPNKYAVTDKADGDRYALYIYNDNVYLISENMNVKKTGMIVNSKYNNSILEGEYVFISKMNRHLYLVFDCLFNGNIDIRNISSFLERLTHADEIIDNNFILSGQKGFKFETYNGKFDVGKILNFYEKSIDMYMDNLNSDIKIEKQFPLIRRKYFIAVNGGQDNEIFKYSELVWRKYNFDSRTASPYILDGLMYHPLDQKYTISVRESKFVEYKWKPPEKNSIDFYILFEKSSETGKILLLYDNSRDDFITGKPYKIAHLYVGTLTRSGEQPVLFQQQKNKYVAHLFLRDGEVRDLEGNIIQDSTVVEFYYNNDPNIPDRHRWTPIRTRYDKTESVQRFGKKYGNYSDIANRIWRSIENPFLMSDINILGNDDVYRKHIDALRSRIGHSTILSEQQENEYYQKTTNLALPMRNFHNWIKSIIIYTFCNPTYEKDNQQTILDFGIGRGGDIMKFYYAKVNFYVGIDIENSGLISPVNGAISRYNRLRRTHPNFPRMYFINADAGTILDYDDQAKVIGNMTIQNKELMEKFFSRDPKKRTLFDRINCQFAIHYMLPNQLVWNNFIENLKMYLKPGGYMLITTFDADKVLEILGENEKYTSYYTNQNGEQEVLFEIIKKYEKLDDNGIIGPGYAIDVYNSLILQEENYVTEYLVQKQFLEQEFLEKCDMQLVETDLFGNQFNIHEDYFKYVAQYEENVKTKKFLMNAAEYYNQKEEVNKASYQMSSLNRYYIFRKNDKLSSQSGGSGIIEEFEDYIFDEMEEYFNPTKFVKRDIKGLDEYSFLNSIFDILKNEKKIPETLNLMDFLKDIKLSLLKDNEISDDKINMICKNLVIAHENTDKETKLDVVLNGLNIFIMNKDCDDDDYQFNNFGKSGKFNKNIPSIFLFKTNKYHPVYSITKEGNINGIFDNKLNFIRKILKEKFLKN
ncbi:mRNA capping enzyme [uncultured virus]|nr:mRNA capping enzyme [uncultured virus]